MPRTATITHNLINPSIPTANELNTEAFGAIFTTGTTNSYKFLWMKGIIKVLEDDVFQTEEIPIERLTREMLLAAYYPLVQFRLSLGKQDQVGKYLSEMSSELLGEDMGEVKKQIEITGVPKDFTKQLTRYVVHRTLTPFFLTELHGMEEHEKHKAIESLAKENYSKPNPPLYRIGKEAIYVHHRWREYIYDNLQLIKAWEEFHWIKFLQRRNPTIPAIPNKAKKPDNRGSMVPQVKFWRMLLNEQQQLKCIYSKELLKPNCFALDHYIPWKFVAHNEIWNLVPTTQKVNSSKSDNLPDERYMEKFIDMQHMCIRSINDNQKKSEAMMELKESYENSLRVSLEKLADRSVLEQAYEQTMGPLLALARRSGFRYPWTHKQG